MNKIMIIGCARSGTAYITKVLQTMGLHIGHEKEKIHGIVSWYLTSPFPIPSAEDKIIYKAILHQVRHPLHTINASLMMDIKGWHWVYKALPQINRKVPLVRKCMLYWLHWNYLAQSQAEWTYRVEDLFKDEVFDEFCSRIGVNISNEKKEELEKIPTDINTRKEHMNLRKKRSNIAYSLDWNDLRKEDSELFDKISRQAKIYGYQQIYST